MTSNSQVITMNPFSATTALNHHVDNPSAFMCSGSTARYCM